MNDNEKNGKKAWQNPIQLDDLLPKDDVQGGTGGRKLIFGASKRNENKSDREKTNSLKKQ